MGQSAGPIGAGLGTLAGVAAAPFTAGTSLAAAMPLAASLGSAGGQLGGSLGSLAGGGGGTPSVAPVAPPPAQHSMGGLQAPIVGHSTAPQGPLTGMGQTSSSIQQLLQNMLMSGRATG